MVKKGSFRVAYLEPIESTNLHARQICFRLCIVYIINNKWPMEKFKIRLYYFFIIVLTKK